MVSKKRVFPLDEKVQVIRDCPTPSTHRQLREFLGLVNFYHYFIPRCAYILQPLNLLLFTTGNELHWTAQATNEFTTIKEALAQATLLSHPQTNAPCAIMTDASNVAVSAVLQQF